MKRNLLLTLVLAFVAYTGAFAQTVPNNSFEDWTSSNGVDSTPVSWDLLSGGVKKMDTIRYTFATKQITATAPVGNYFMGLYTKPISSTQAQLGIVRTKFAYTQRPDSIKWSALYFPRSGNANERYGVIVVLTKSTGANKRDTIAYSTLLGPALYDTTNSKFVNLSGRLTNGYRKPGQPDSASIILFSDINTSAVGLNTMLVIDNISFGTGLVSGVEETGKLVGNVHNYPNPFSNTTTIAYELRTSGQVSLKVYDISGREVSTLVNTTQGAGKHQAEFNGSDLSEGVYIYQLRAGDAVSTGKMIISK